MNGATLALGLVGAAVVAETIVRARGSRSTPSRYEDSAIMEAKHIEVAAAHREAATAGGHRGEVHRAAAKMHDKAADDNRYNPNSADARATSDQARNATLRIGYTHSVRWPESTRGSRSMEPWDFGFDDEPTAEVLTWRTVAIRAFEAQAHAPAEMIETSDLFREPPNGIDAAVYWVARYVRNATPGWLVLAPNVATEAAARALGARVIRTLRPPRGLRADQIRLHGLPLTVGWTGGSVRVGEAEGSRAFASAQVPGQLLGYRLMRFDPKTNEAVTRIGHPIRLPLKRGAVHRLPGRGMFLSNSEAYVRDYYAGHDHEVLLTYAFDPARVTSGSMDDREPEITVPEAVLVDWQVLEADA